MNKLLKKDFTLAMHPTCIMFILLSTMLLIPNYPYYVVFFYTGLGIYFTCLLGRENNDIVYSMTLPVAKKDIVKARFEMIVILELIQIIVAVPFALLRQSFTHIPPNQVGMDANIALFGLSFIMLGIFNYIFLVKYYKNVMNVGKSFLYSSIGVFLYIAITETLCHIIPFFRDKLDTPDTMYIKEKLIVLAVGIIAYAVITLLTYKKSVKIFDKLDI